MAVFFKEQKQRQNNLFFFAFQTCLVWVFLEELPDFGCIVEGCTNDQAPCVLRLRPLGQQLLQDTHQSTWKRDKNGPVTTHFWAFQGTKVSQLPRQSKAKNFAGSSSSLTWAKSSRSIHIKKTKKSGKSVLSPTWSWHPEEIRMVRPQKKNLWTDVQSTKKIPSTHHVIPNSISGRIRQNNCWFHNSSTHRPGSISQVSKSQWPCPGNRMGQGTETEQRWGKYWT